MIPIRQLSIILSLYLLCLVEGQTTVRPQNGYQPNTATPPKSQPYTGAPFVYSTTMNPTLNAEKTAGILPSSQQNQRNSRQIQYQSSTYSPFGSTQYSNQMYNNGNGGQSMSYNGYNYNNNNNQQMINAQYGPYNQPQQYPYTSQQNAYNNGFNSLYQSSTPSSSYLLRDQNSNYNYRPFNQGYSNGYNGQALYNPLSNQYTSPSSFNQQNGFSSNWNSNYQSNFASPYKRSQRRKRQMTNSAASNFQSTTSSPSFYSSSQTNAFVNPQFDPNPRNANPGSLVQNPNYKYLTSGLENLYLSSYNRLYDPSGNSNFPQPATEAPVLTNDAQNQLNYQKIQNDYVGGRDRYQQDNSEVTNNIYGYDYSSSSTRFGRK